jgi:hypothetical protein
MRFWSKVSFGEDCWEWTGAKIPDGYGQFRVGQKAYPSHRLAYENLVGPVPEGLQLDHLCRNRICVRPSHLDIVTQRENVTRGMSPSACAARSGLCALGHALDYSGPQGRCLTCRALYRQNYYKRRKGAEGGWGKGWLTPTPR